MRDTACTLVIVSGLLLTACGSNSTSSDYTPATPRSEETLIQSAPENSHEGLESTPTRKTTDSSVETTASSAPVLENLPDDFPSEVPLLGYVAPESIGTDLTRKLYDGMWSVSMRSTESNEELNKEMAGQLLLDAGYTDDGTGNFTNGNYEVGFFVLNSLLTYAVRATWVTE